MPAYVESMAYSGEVPWHKMGTQVGEAQTSEEMIVAAGLDWEVAVGDLWGGESQKTMAEFEDWRSIYRVNDNKMLGVCLGRFVPVQNREVFSFMDSLLSDGVLRYETAGSLKGGRRVFALAKLQGLGAEIAGDTYESYLLGMNGHDNLLSLRVFPTFVRVVCSNTLQMALDARGRQMHGGIMIRHSGNVVAKMQTAREILKITTDSQRRMAQWLEIAANTPVAEEQAIQVQQTMFGSLDEETPTRRENAIKAFFAIYSEESLHSGENAYALVNAVTGYADHAMKTRGSKDDEGDAFAMETRVRENRFASVLMDTGTSNVWKAKGLHAIETILGLPKLSDIKLQPLEAATAAS